MAVTRRQIMEKAISVFGSRDQARRWLSEPSMALEQQAPKSLVGSAKGRLIVDNLLTQLEFCVYV